MMRLSLMCVLLAACALAAAPARAAEVNLWACRTPAGTPATYYPFAEYISTHTQIARGCVAQDDFTHVGYTAPPLNNETATLTLALPPGVTLDHVLISRTAKGPGYFARTDTLPLERIDDASTLSADLDVPATGTSVVIGILCSTPVSCPSADPYVDVRYMRLSVSDPTPPDVALGGIGDTAAGIANLTVTAHDAGIGLATMRATLDGAQFASGAYSTCTDLVPGGEADLAFGTTCAHDGTLGPLALDTRRYADGPHQLAVTVTDAAGNESTKTLAVNFANGSPAPQPTATPTPAPSGEPTDTGDVVTVPTKIKLSSRVSFTVSCPKASKARCTLRFTSAGKRLATGTGSLAPGHRGKITLTLSAAAKRRLQRTHRLKGTLTLYEGKKKLPGVAVTLRTS